MWTATTQSVPFPDLMDIHRPAGRPWKGAEIDRATNAIYGSIVRQEKSIDFVRKVLLNPGLPRVLHGWESVQSTAQGGRESLFRYCRDWSPGLHPERVSL